MKIVAIKDMSAGNETIGEMWQETKVFDGGQPISDIIEWAKGNDKVSHTRKRITITVPHN